MDHLRKEQVAATRWWKQQRQGKSLGLKANSDIVTEHRYFPQQCSKRERE